MDGYGDRTADTSPIEPLEKVQVSIIDNEQNKQQVHRIGSRVKRENNSLAVIWKEYAGRNTQQ
jgi:hypothetical protein